MNSVVAWLRRNQVRLGTRLVFHDVSGDCACCNSEGRGKIHLSGSATAREIAILRADDDLIGARGHSWTCVDAGSTAGLDHLRPGSFENVQISATQAVISRLLRAELNYLLAKGELDVATGAAPK